MTQDTATERKTFTYEIVTTLSDVPRLFVTLVPPAEMYAYVATARPVAGRFMSDPEPVTLNTRHLVTYRAA